MAGGPVKIAVVTGTRTDNRPHVIADALRRYGPDFTIVGCATGVDEEARLACQRLGYDHAVCPALWLRHDKKAGPRRNDLMAFLAAAVAHFTASEPTIFAVPWGEARGTRDCAERACPEMGLTNVEWL